jgi:formate dehydrogenase subunit gamma
MEGVNLPNGTRAGHALAWSGAGAAVLALLVALAYLVLTRLPGGYEVASFKLLRGDALWWLCQWLFAAIALCAVLHYFRYGPKDMRPRGPEDRVLWWWWVERVIHWVCATAFTVLLVSGVQLFLTGGGLPGATTRLMRSLHVGEPYLASGGVLFLLWFREAVPRRYDSAWVRHLGGYFGHKGHLPAGKFNAGQKFWFWVASLTSIAMAVTGYRLQYTYTRFDAEYYPQLLIHLGAAIVFLATISVHIYLSIIAVKGSLWGMLSGSIGRTGARALHSEADELKASRAG